jgi:hypothetical protein
MYQLPNLSSVALSRKGLDEYLFRVICPFSQAHFLYGVLKMAKNYCGSIIALVWHLCVVEIEHLRMLRDYIRFY